MEKFVEILSVKMSGNPVQTNRTCVLFFKGPGWPPASICAQPADSQGESGEEGQRRRPGLRGVRQNRRRHSSLQTRGSVRRLRRRQPQVKPRRREPPGQPQGQQRLHGTGRTRKPCHVSNYSRICETWCAVLFMFPCCGAIDWLFHPMITFSESVT